MNHSIVMTLLELLEKQHCTYACMTLTDESRFDESSKGNTRIIRDRLLNYKWSTVVGMADPQSLTTKSIVYLTMFGSWVTWLAVNSIRTKSACLYFMGYSYIMCVKIQFTYFIDLGITTWDGTSFPDLFLFDTASDRTRC